MSTLTLVSGLLFIGVSVLLMLVCALVVWALYAKGKR